MFSMVVKSAKEVSIVIASTICLHRCRRTGCRNSSTIIQRYPTIKNKLRSVAKRHTLYARKAWRRVLGSVAQRRRYQGPCTGAQVPVTATQILYVVSQRPQVVDTLLQPSCLRISLYELSHHVLIAILTLLTAVLLSSPGSRRLVPEL